jgi:O-antigen/teichoic acid export membrane protein
MVLAVVAPLLFSVAFGDSWREAGWIAVLLTPCMYLQALVSPLSQTLLIIEKQRLNLALDICRVVVLASGLSVGKFAEFSVLGIVALYSGLMTVLYLAYLKVYDVELATAQRRRAASSHHEVAQLGGEQAIQTRQG